MEQADEGIGGESLPRRVRRSPEQWRALVEGQPASGQRVEEYCRGHQVTPSSFYRWQQFLSGNTGATSPWAKPKSRPLPAIAGFAAVHLKQDPEPRSSPGDSIRLMLAGGRELILPASMPAGRLVELLVALESMPSRLESKPAKPEREV
jgi:hypothetical protein